jgi:hypothetical protein
MSVVITKADFNQVYINVTFGVERIGCAKYLSNVTFLNKVNLKRTLDRIPEYSVLTIDGSDCNFIDYDILSTGFAVTFDLQILVELSKLVHILFTFNKLFMINPNSTFIWQGAITLVTNLEFTVMPIIQAFRWNFH